MPVWKGKRSLRVLMAITISSSEQLPGALADAVDGALDLPRAGLHGGERVGDRQAQIVVAMDADDGAIAQRLDDAADQRAVLFRHRIADRVGDVDGAGAGGDHGLGDLLQELGLGAGAVFGGELDVIDVTARQFDGGHGFVEHLLPAIFLSLYFR